LGLTAKPVKIHQGGTITQSTEHTAQIRQFKRRQSKKRIIRCLPRSNSSIILVKLTAAWRSRRAIFGGAGGNDICICERQREFATLAQKRRSSDPADALARPCSLEAAGAQHVIGTIYMARDTRLKSEVGPSSSLKSHSVNYVLATFIQLSARSEQPDRFRNLPRRPFYPGSWARNTQSAFITQTGDAIYTPPAGDSGAPKPRHPVFICLPSVGGLPNRPDVLSR